MLSQRSKIEIQACRGEAARGKLAFTVVEMLVVCGVIGLLAALLVPAVSASQARAKRTSCVNNLRQLYLGCVIYASENGDWFPAWDNENPGSADSLNVLNDNSMARYLVNDCTLEPAPWKVPKSSAAVEAAGGSFENLGWLYADDVAGSGSIFFCPSFSPNSPLSSAPYQGDGLISTSTNDNCNCVRSSYTYNMVCGLDRRRTYQKAGDITRRDVFLMDYFDQGMTNADRLAHFAAKGWNVTFTDGAVGWWSPRPSVYALITNGSSLENYYNFSVVYRPAVVNETR